MPAGGAPQSQHPPLPLRSAFQNRDFLKENIRDIKHSVFFIFDLLTLSPDFPDLLKPGPIGASLLIELLPGNKREKSGVCSLYFGFRFFYSFSLFY